MFRGKDLYIYYLYTLGSMGSLYLERIRVYNHHTGCQYIQVNKRKLLHYFVPCK